MAKARRLTMITMAWALVVLVGPALAGGPENRGRIPTAEIVTLDVATRDDARILARLAVPKGQEWCLEWRHSVTHGAVADCFSVDDGLMVLRRSFLHDAAAGLGHLPGRGRQRAAPGGGYWIDAINERLPGNALNLRIGQPRVGHRVTLAGRDAIDLSGRWPGKRVTLRPMTKTDQARPRADGGPQPGG